MGAVKLNRFPILLHGKSGSGKSCAAAAMYRYWRLTEQDGWAMWFEWVRLSAFMVGLKLQYHNWFDAIEFKKFSKDNLLVVDDIGTREASGAVQDCLMVLANTRRYLPTVYTCNVSPTELADVYDDRIVDRITCGTVIHVDGQSRR